MERGEKRLKSFKKTVESMPGKVESGDRRGRLVGGKSCVSGPGNPSETEELLECGYQGTRTRKTGSGGQ